MEELRQRIYSESNVHGVRLKRYVRFHSKKIRISWIREHMKFESIHLTFGAVYICLLHVTAITTFNEIKKDLVNRSIFDGFNKQLNINVFYISYTEIIFCTRNSRSGKLEYFETLFRFVFVLVSLCTGLSAQRLWSVYRYHLGNEKFVISQIRNGNFNRKSRYGRLRLFMRIVYLNNIKSN